MRLIDADKLKPDAEWNGWDKQFTCYSKKQIENAPTVDAVDQELYNKAISMGLALRRKCELLYACKTEEMTEISKRIAKDIFKGLERKRGEWKEHYYLHFEVPGIECSVCGEDVPYWGRHHAMPNYCPNCGADMRGNDK